MKKNEDIKQFIDYVKTNEKVLDAISVLFKSYHDFLNTLESDDMCKDDFRFEILKAHIKGEFLTKQCILEIINDFFQYSNNDNLYGSARRKLRNWLKEGKIKKICMLNIEDDYEYNEYYMIT